MTEPDIAAAVQAKTYVKRIALRELVERGSVTRSGEGVRGSPFKYEVARSEVACSLVPAPIEKTGNEKPSEQGPSESKKNLVPVTYKSVRNKETRNSEALDECLSIDQKLVPAKTEDSTNPEEPGTGNSAGSSPTVRPKRPQVGFRRRERRRLGCLTRLRRRPRAGR